MVIALIGWAPPSIELLRKPKPTSLLQYVVGCDGSVVRRWHDSPRIACQYRRTGLLYWQLHLRASRLQTTLYCACWPAQVYRFGVELFNCSGAVQLCSVCGMLEKYMVECM